MKEREPISDREAFAINEELADLIERVASDSTDISLVAVVTIFTDGRIEATSSDGGSFAADLELPYE